MTDTHDTNLPEQQTGLEEEQKAVEVSEETAVTETPAEQDAIEQPAEPMQKLTQEEILAKLKEIAQNVESTSKAEIDGLKHPIITIVLLQRPVHIDPTPYDNKPVDIFFFLIVPKTDNDDEYLPLLRECIAMLENKTLCADLRKAENAVEICSAIMNWTAPTVLARESQEDALENEWDLLNEEVKAQRKEEEESLVVAAVENNA